MTNYLDLEIVEINKLLKEKKLKPIDLVNEAFLKIEKNSEMKSSMQNQSNKSDKCNFPWWVSEKKLLILGKITC